MQRISHLFLIVLLVFLSCSKRNDNTTFQDKWSVSPDRVWVGSDFWANRLQDWRITGGRLECVIADEKKPMRMVPWLTGRVKESNGSMTLRVKTGVLGKLDSLNSDAASGFLIGVGDSMDYRSSALIHHSRGAGSGLFVGIDTQGNLFIRDQENNDSLLAHTNISKKIGKEVELRLGIHSDGDTKNVLEISAFSNDGEEINHLRYESLSNADIAGNIALVSHPGTGENPASFWFRNLHISGSRLEQIPERNLGPIISAQYTLSKRFSS